MDTGADCGKDLRESTGYLFSKVNNLVQGELRRGLGALGITPPQFTVLAALENVSGSGSCITQAQIARYAGMDVMTVSQVIRTLERRGLLARTQSPKDARARAVRLLPEGTAVLGQAFPIVHRVTDELFGCLDARRALFNEMLRALLCAKRHTPHSADTAE